MQSAVGKIPKDASFFDNAKTALKVIIGITLFFLVILDYITKLGTEKD